jgi:hypothetical protein
MRYQIRRYDGDPNAPMGTVEGSFETYKEALEEVSNYAFKWSAHVRERGDNYVTFNGGFTYAAVDAQALPTTGPESQS